MKQNEILADEAIRRGFMETGLKRTYDRLLFEFKTVLEAKDQEYKVRIESLEAENEKLKNRVNLLSVSAERIRDAYDNGYVKDLQAKIAMLVKCLEEVKNKCRHDPQDLCLTPTRDIPCFCFVGETLAKIRGEGC